MTKDFLLNKNILITGATSGIGKSLTKYLSEHGANILMLSKDESKLDVLYDETDTNGQTALAVGSSVTLNFAPEGSDSGDVKLTGTAIVTGKSISSSFDGLVEASITVQGNGGLTTTTY